MADEWRQIAHQIVAERSRRWPTRQQFADACHLGKRVLDDIENGRRTNYSDSTLARVEAALGWEPGEIRARAQGIRLQRRPDRNMRRILDVWPDLSDDARAMLASVAESAVRGRN